MLYSGDPFATLFHLDRRCGPPVGGVTAAGPHHSVALDHMTLDRLTGHARDLLSGAAAKGERLGFLGVPPRLGWGRFELHLHREHLILKVPVPKLALSSVTPRENAAWKAQLGLGLRLGLGLGKHTEAGRGRIMSRILFFHDRRWRGRHRHQ